MNKKKSFNSSERILSVSAIVIAVVSIVISVWEGIETRKHNRLSVMPKLEITYKRSGDHFGYIVTNNGLGPAIIISKKILVDGQEINYSGFSGIEDFLEKLDLQDKFVKQGVIDPGYTIRSGDHVQIVLFTLTGVQNAEELLMNVHNRVSIEIQYKSMYGDTYFCKTK